MLALSDLDLDKKTGEIVEIKNPRRLETHAVARNWTFGASLTRNDCWPCEDLRRSHRKNQARSLSRPSSSFYQSLGR